MKAELKEYKCWDLEMEDSPDGPDSLLMTYLAIGCESAVKQYVPFLVDAAGDGEPEYDFEIGVICPNGDKKSFRAHAETYLTVSILEC